MIHIKCIFSPENDPELLRLLAEQGLTLPRETDLALGVYDEGSLAGCGFLKRNMLQGLAVRDKYQGEGISNRLLTELIKEAAARGIRELYLITKPAMTDRFESMGWRKVVSAPPYASLLEYGRNSVRTFREKLENLQTAVSAPGLSAAAVVMNGNPFTRGHRYLVEQAAQDNARVYVLVVQEDLSLFSFQERFEMAKAALADISNVTVLPGGPYVVSLLTFPTYFTKEENLAAAQSALDAEMFGTVYVPALKITRRYVGSEPCSPVTAVYNQAMKDRLPKYGVEVVEIPRMEEGGQIVSASRVRQWIEAGDMESIRSLVPSTVLPYIQNRLNKE